MIKNDIIDRIRSSIRGEILRSEPLDNHTTYRVGGEAEYLVCPRNSEEAALVYGFATEENIPCTVIGWGSNVIAPDDGIGGIVLKMKSDSADIRFVGGERLVADAGVSLIDLARKAAEKGLDGLAPISGIPGTVGGAITMNAGTKEGDTAAVLDKIEVITPELKRRIFSVKECAFGYRRSLFQRVNWLILNAEFRLMPGSPSSIMDKVDRNWEERQRKFPLDQPSAGSVFKRPKGDYAGRLIEEAGCKGLRVGGAVVSERHANFILNTGGATASDIVALVDEIRRRVFLRTGVYLEMEQEILGTVKWTV